MEQIKVVQESPDDFDVRELLIQWIQFFRKYSLLISIFFLAGLLIGLFVYVRTPKLYSSTLLLQPVILTRSEQIQSINSLNNILEQQQYDELAARFNCNPQVVKKLSSIKGEDEDNESGTRYAAFKVKIEITDPSIVPTIQKGIIYALENGEFVKQKLAAQRSSFKAMIDITAHEINRLDSTRTSIEKNMMTPRSSPSSVILDVSDINRTTVSLNEKLFKLKDSLNFTAAAHVLQDFYNPSQPDEPKLIKTVGLGAAAGLVLGVLISFCLFVFRGVKTSKTV
jgi:hypothetical protein